MTHPAIEELMDGVQPAHRWDLNSIGFEDEIGAQLRVNNDVGNVFGFAVSDQGNETWVELTNAQSRELIRWMAATITYPYTP